MVLVLIGYLSFYFDIENFTDRAMVVLTTMLVIATITSSIQAVSFVLTFNVFRFVGLSIYYINIPLLKKGFTYNIILQIN